MPCANALQDPVRAARVVPNLLFLSVEGGRVMGDEVRATIGSGWPIFVGGDLRANHDQHCSRGSHKQEASFGTFLIANCKSTFLCSQGRHRQKRVKKALEVLCQNGDLAKTGDVVAFKRAVGNGQTPTNDVGELDIRPETGIRGVKLVLCGAKPVCITHVHCVSVCVARGHGGSYS